MWEPAKARKNKEYEYVTTYYCKARNKNNKSCCCGFEMKIVRLKNGLVALEKCETVGDRKVPIEYNATAYNKFRNTTKRSQNDVKMAVPLSVAQKTIIAQHYSLDGNPDMFVKPFLDQPRVPYREQDS